jgi:serine protease AprX
VTLPVSRREESPVHLRLKTIAVAAVAAALAAGAGVAAPAGAATRSADSSRLVSAVVSVRPGVALPLAVPGGRVVATFDRVGSELVRAPMTALTALAADPRVAGVSPDRAGRVMGAGYGGGTRTDGVYASQFLGGTVGKGLGSGVNVALLDTGLTDTAALSRASGRVTDGVDVSEIASGGDAHTSGQFTDGYGHGSFLASLIAGGPVAGSGGRSVGVAPEARIVVVKVADDEGVTSLSQVLAGMDWVAAHAAAIQVLNIALAVERPTAPAYGADPLTAAVEHVRDAGVLVVAAAGNTPGEVGDPGLSPDAFTVGAADLTEGSSSVADFSGSGNVAGVSKPDVVASGVHVLGAMPATSAIAADNPSGWQANGLFRGSGTSEATAVASGVAAAWFSSHPGGDPADAKAALRGAATGAVRGAGAGAGLVQLATGNRGSHGNASTTGEDDLDASSWNANAWNGGNWVDLLASSWSASSWSASSWSASSWSASSWSASSWSASSWSASSWSASSWSASSWSASSWSASSWSAFGWGDDA